MAAVAGVAGTFLLLGFGIWIGLGLLAAYVATEKGRSGCAWFGIGVIFGPIAFLALIAVPAKLPDGQTHRAWPGMPSSPAPMSPVSKECPQCGATLRASAELCRGCGYAFEPPAAIDILPQAPGATGDLPAVPVEITALVGRWRVRRSSILAVPTGSVVEISVEAGALVIASWRGKLRTFRAGEVRCARERAGGVQLWDGTGLIVTFDHYTQG